MPIFTFVADKTMTIRRDVQADNLDEAIQKYRAGEIRDTKQSLLRESLRLIEDEHGRVRMRYEGRFNLAGDAYDDLLLSCYHVLMRIKQIYPPEDSLGSTARSLASLVTLMRSRYAREVEPRRDDWIAIAESYLVVIEQLIAGKLHVGEELAEHVLGSEAAVRRALAMARSSDAPSDTARWELYLNGTATFVSFSPEQEEVDSGPLGLR